MESGVSLVTSRIMEDPFACGSTASADAAEIRYSAKIKRRTAHRIMALLGTESRPKICWYIPSEGCIPKLEERKLHLFASASAEFSEAAWEHHSERAKSRTP